MHVGSYHGMPIIPLKEHADGEGFFKPRDSKDGRLESESRRRSVIVWLLRNQGPGRA
jgi:hypothetical protein